MRPIRLPLRRYISIPPAAPPRHIRDRTKIAIGASLAIAGYATWRLAGSDQRIALDASSQRVTHSTPTPSAQSKPSIQLEHEDGESPAKPETDSKSGGVEESEEESEGAFNPSTGEINWDCPCLGGMAHGPCGEQFRAAFSCFVFSEQEPKGIDCVEKFKNMQDCFREHPDVYGEEIADEDDADDLPSAADKLPQPESSPAPVTMTPSSHHSTLRSNAIEADSKTK